MNWKVFKISIGKALLRTGKVILISLGVVGGILIGMCLFYIFGLISLVSIILFFFIFSIIAIYIDENEKNPVER